MTSANRAIVNIPFLVCYFAGIDQAWKTSEPINLTQYPLASSLFVAINSIPYWIRFAQSCHRFLLSNDYSANNSRHFHLLNSVKYLCLSVSYILMLFLTPGVRDKYFLVYMVLRIWSELFAYVWDVTVDWGLWQDSWLLREKKLFPTWFYYWAMIANFLLRFVFLVPFFANFYL